MYKLQYLQNKCWGFALTGSVQVEQEAMVFYATQPIK